MKFRKNLKCANLEHDVFDTQIHVFIIGNCKL